VGENLEKVSSKKTPANPKFIGSELFTSWKPFITLFLKYFTVQGFLKRNKNRQTHRCTRRWSPRTAQLI